MSSGLFVRALLCDAYDALSVCCSYNYVETTGLSILWKGRPDQIILLVETLKERSGHVQELCWYRCSQEALRLS